MGKQEIKIAQVHKAIAEGLRMAKPFKKNIDKASVIRLEIIKEFNLNFKRGKKIDPRQTKIEVL